MRVPALAAAVMAVACAMARQGGAADAGASLLPTAKVIVEAKGGRSFGLTVEVAARPPDRERGLMFRKNLDTDHGMLFVFPEPAQQSFWMHNTLIPLDMLFVAEDGTVLGVVEQAEPLTNTSRSVRGLSKYVLEVIGGWCADRGVGAGARITVQGLESIAVQ
jgi:uncharacterized protein